MDDSGTTVRTSLEVQLDPSEAFDTFFDELAAALARKDYSLEVGPAGRLVQGGFEVGRIVSWEPGTRAVFEWRPAAWEPEETTEVAVLFESSDGGTRITLEHREWGRSIQHSTDLVGWFGTEVATPFVEATAPDAFGEWLTDRRARRPSGISARNEYSDPLYHYPNFRVILAELALTADDYLLEVGCGGGVLLGEAIERGCRAAAVDHSPDMVESARRNNRDALETGRLEVREASAEDLPFPDETFTCATMTGVLGHLPDPTAVFGELYRVLEDGGRIVILGSDPELRGTPAAPEPVASRMHFYESEGLERLATEAGFGDVRVVRHNQVQDARDVGIPDDHLPLFDYPGRFLLARKPPA